MANVCSLRMNIMDSEATRLINRRKQGDLGEASAIEWFTRLGATVFIPFGHSPDVDLVALLDGQLLRVQVKASTQTSTTPTGGSRHSVTVRTGGGNRSWTGIAKRLDPDRIDFLFVLTGDGRRWCIPAAALEAGNSLSLGGQKYAEFEIDTTAPIRPLVYGDAPLDSSAGRGEYPSGQRMATVNRPAQPSEVRILSPPLPESRSVYFSSSKYERKLGQVGRANINPKRRVTIPLGAAQEAGLRVGDQLRIRAEGYGRLILERAELP